jgi:hypothetical protein
LAFTTVLSILGVFNKGKICGNGGRGRVWAQDTIVFLFYSGVLLAFLLLAKKVLYLTFLSLS